MHPSALCATALYAEDELLPLSGLAHLAACERRWALVHMEQQWAENRFTAEGAHLHEKAHSAKVENRPGAIIQRTLALRSLRLGLSGQSDVVEFVPSQAEHAVSLPGKRGKWQAYPIEYKRAKDKAGSIAYRLQLCAQAMCLEEMLATLVPEAAVYDATTHRRQVVEVNVAVRNEVERLCLRMHELHRAGRTPATSLKPICRACSLAGVCMPSAMHSARRVADYIRAMSRSEP